MMPLSARVSNREEESLPRKENTEEEARKDDRKCCGSFIGRSEIAGEREENLRSDGDESQQKGENFEADQRDKGKNAESKSGISGSNRGGEM